MLWPGKCFLMLFGFPRQNIYHSSEMLKVIYIKCSMFYARIYYQFKTSELKGVVVGEANSSCLKVLLEKDWECAFLYNVLCDITSYRKACVHHTS